ncbi:MAG: helix-turn-helix domain-containing protein, partial [Actinobacteria bacterium]|nr:helix-turn-helix domain-containing protein [Actinomycetota bacterium]
MSIGETLASARQQAALSTTDVSHRTRIREGLIQDIENDDYSECGGDFYARGHIRSIAKAVGIDGEPLIREYDQVHRAPDAITDVMQLVATSRAAMAEEQAPESPAGPEELWEQPGEPAWEADP